MLFSLLFYITSVESANKYAFARYVECKPIVDGLFEDSIWIYADWHSDLIQIQPQYRAQSTYRTEFAAIYSKDKIFIGVKCYYKEKPSAKTLKRDSYDTQEDGVLIFFDPSSDRMNYYVFGVSYLNIQTDGTGMRSFGDYNWDGIWESRVVDYDSFYFVEIAIPFKCFAIQFRDTAGFNVIRTVYSTREVLSWTDVGSNLFDPSLFGKLIIEMERVKKEKFLLSYPYFTFRYLKEENLDEEEMGGEILFRLKHHHIGFTYNSEYCELEPDAEVINLVEGSEVYLSEKRPFFLEGFNMYSWNLFYTRRVSDILWAGKFFGKLAEKDYSTFFIQTPDTTQFFGLANGGNITDKICYSLGVVGRNNDSLELCQLSDFSYNPIKELTLDIAMRLNYKENFQLKEGVSISSGLFYNHPRLKSNIEFSYNGMTSFPTFGYYGLHLPYNQYTGTIYIKPRFFFRKISEYSPSINLSYTVDENGVRIKESESFSNFFAITPASNFSISLSNFVYQLSNSLLRNTLLNTSLTLGKTSLFTLGSICGYLNDNKMIMPFINISTTISKTITVSLSFQNKFLWIDDSLAEKTRLAVFRTRLKPWKNIELRTFCQYSDVSKTILFNWVAKIILLHNLTIYFAFVDNEDISSDAIENKARRIFLKGIYFLSF
ncbi:MAG: sugar-binding protein [Bacteroidales bacterium]